MIRFLLLLLISVFVSLPAMAGGYNYDDFATLPVQHEGRIKPMDSVARAFLKNFSGSDSVGGMSASAWMADTLFNPAEALEQPIFRLLKPDVAGLSQREGRLYNFIEISQGLKSRESAIARLQTIPQKDWSDDQRALMRLHEQSILYLQLLRSFSTLLPLNIDVPDDLQKEWTLPDSVTLQDLQKFDASITKKIETLIRRKGEDIDKYTDAEKALAAFSYETGILKEGAKNNFLLRVVPSGDVWVSPWVAIQEGKDGDIIAQWKDAATAYNKGDAAAFSRAVETLLSSYPHSSRITLETFYNKIHPLGSAMIFYLLAFLAFAGQRLSGKNLMGKASLLLLSAGGFLHGFAIAARIIILERPPVGTLYESILFVSFICVLFGFIFELRRKDGLGVLIGALCGLLMLFISGSFAGEDSMQVLIAVLNTNFWLATHVLCITIGYAICVIAASLAHVALLQNAFGTSSPSLYPALRTTGLMALLFTAVGTILGGIWADQSWGRFWGWDPKENGALLIVLWLIWVYHGSLSGHLRKVPFMAAMAALNIVVALAWFGVNLLNVGLHSYGFISGVAMSLGAFCAAELILIAFLWYRIEKKRTA